MTRRCMFCNKPLIEEGDLKVLKALQAFPCPANKHQIEVYVHTVMHLSLSRRTIYKAVDRLLRACLIMKAPTINAQPYVLYQLDTEGQHILEAVHP